MDGSSQHEVMSKAQVDMVRSRAKGKNADAWTLHYPEQGRKTVVRRLSKYMPLTVEAVEAIAKDDEREFGVPTVAAVIGARAASLKDSIRTQAEEIEGAAVEVPVASADQPTDAAIETTPERCGSLSDPALGEIEQCGLAPDHLGVKGSQRRHRAPSGSIWPAKEIA